MQLQYQTARLKAAGSPAQKDGSPSMGWLERLRVGQKLGLMTLLLGVPVVLLTGTLLRQGFIENNRIIKELHGLQTIGTMAELISGAYNFAYGHVYNTPKDAKDGATQTNASIATLEGKLTGPAKVSLANLKSDWQNLQTFATSGGAFTTVNNYQLLLQTNEQLLMDNIISEYGFDTDKSPATTATMQAIRYLAKTAGQMQLVSLDMAQLKLNPNDPLLVLISRRNMDIAFDSLSAYEAAMSRAYAYDPNLKPKLNDTINTFSLVTRDALNRTDSALKTGNVYDSLPPAYSHSLNGARDVYIATLTNLGNQMLAQVKRGYVTLALQTALLLAALIAAGWLVLAVSRRITQPLQRLTDASHKISSGDYGVQVPVTSADELGTLSMTFNNAAGQLRQNAEHVDAERVETQKLQGNISQFLDVMMDIADGDLTKRGQVTGDVLGNVVDSINLMTDELSKTLLQVRAASESVTEGSNSMLHSTDQIHSHTRVTTDETRRAAQQARELNTNIAQMAAIAQATAESARRAQHASEQGQEAVKETLEGMQNIRQEVQSVAKGVKGLGDRSLQIQEIVDTIAHISSQVNLLSLHASLEAAGAGEAGTRFAVVADEIRELADLSTEATSNIAKLISEVQHQIQNVIISVEEGSREVEQGYQVAQQAGDRLREISELTQVSTHFANNISTATRTQVQGVQQMNGAVNQIASVAQQSQSSVEQGRQAAQQLQALAQQLSANLARFRLPAETV